jgi:hypothetical protein
MRSSCFGVPCALSDRNLGTHLLRRILRRPGAVLPPMLCVIKFAGSAVTRCCAYSAVVDTHIGCFYVP